MDYVSESLHVSTGLPHYVSTLPAGACPHLDLQLDWDNGGVEIDLSQIAHHMLDWELKLSTHLGLTEVDVHDITRSISDLELQRCVWCLFLCDSDL